MALPPYRNPNEGHERDDDRRRERDESERWSRSREREPGRFRRDLASSFENEDRAFDDVRHPGREREWREFEDWQQPRRYGAPEHEWQSSRGRGSYERERYGAYDEEPRRFGYGQQEFPPSSRSGSRGGYGYGGRAERGGFFGERGGNYAGRGPKNYRRSDQRIQEEVCDRLTSDPHVDASEIQVTVKDAEVTLEGSVMERRMKRLAEDCVETVSGVSQVHNRLRVEDSTAQRSQGSQAQPGEGSLGSVRQSSGRAE
jgi:hypothetical protein